MEREKQLFLSYVKKFPFEEHRGYQLKVDHTFRVVENALEISKSLTEQEKMQKEIGLCALLHDIGRFEQLRKYGSFVDRKTIDHGDFGAKLLEEGMLKEYTNDEELSRLILLSVKYHNKLQTPKDLTKKEELYVNVVRDADKIDILHLVAEKEIKMKSLGKERVSKKVMQAFKEHRLVNLLDLQTKLDRVCVWLAFVFDLNYEKSLDLLEEKGYLKKIISYYKEMASPIGKQDLEEMEKEIQEYRKERREYVGSKI